MQATYLYIYTKIYKYINNASDLKGTPSSYLLFLLFPCPMFLNHPFAPKHSFRLARDVPASPRAGLAACLLQVPRLFAYCVFLKLTAT